MHKPPTDFDRFCTGFLSSIMLGCMMLALYLVCCAGLSICTGPYIGPLVALPCSIVAWTELTKRKK
jgi:hypothetical protein